LCGVTYTDYSVVKETGEGYLKIYEYGPTKMGGSTLGYCDKGCTNTMAASDEWNDKMDAFTV